MCPSGPTCHVDLPKRHLQHLSLLRFLCRPQPPLNTWLSLFPSSKLGRGGYNVGTVGGRETSSTGGGGEGKSPSSLALPLVLGVPFVFRSMEGKVGVPPPPNHNIFPLTFLAWVLPAPEKSCFLLFQDNIPGPKGVCAVSSHELMYRNWSGWLGCPVTTEYTQPELCPVLGFPLRATSPQRMASLSHRRFQACLGLTLYHSLLQSPFASF